MAEAQAEATAAGRPWWASFVFSLVLFSLSYTTNCVQREGQQQQMRRQADELAEQRQAVQEIKAMMAARKPGG